MKKKGATLKEEAIEVGAIYTHRTRGYEVKVLSIDEDGVTNIGLKGIGIPFCESEECFTSNFKLKGGEDE